MQPSLLSSQAGQSCIGINQIKGVLDYISCKELKLEFTGPQLEAGPWRTISFFELLLFEITSEKISPLVRFSSSFLFLVILSFMSAMPFLSSLSIITLLYRCFLNPSSTVRFNSPIILCQQNGMLLFFLSDKTV